MEELKNFGITPLFLDVTKEDSLADCVDKILTEAGQIDILINNAGSGYIPLSYLASYLGITQSSLSRIRKNIR